MNYSEITNRKMARLSKGDKIRKVKQNDLLVQQMTRVTEKSNKIIQDLHDSLNEVHLRLKLPHLKENEIAELKRIEYEIYE